MNAQREHSLSGILDSEKGSALMIALVILFALTVLGISAQRLTETEVRYAGRDQSHRTAFYRADSGIYTTPMLIERSFAEDGLPDLSGMGISYPNHEDLPEGTPDFYRQIMGFSETAPNTWDGAVDDISFPMGEPVSVDVRRDRVRNIVGGGVEFASGAEGVGVGSAGGVAIYIDMNSKGEGPGSTSANITAEYRHVNN